MSPSKKSEVNRNFAGLNFWNNSQIGFSNSGSQLRVCKLIARSNPPPPEIWQIKPISSLEGDVRNFKTFVVR